MMKHETLQNIEINLPNIMRINYLLIVKDGHDVRFNFTYIVFVIIRLDFYHNW